MGAEIEPNNWVAMKKLATEYLASDRYAEAGSVLGRLVLQKGFSKGCRRQWFLLAECLLLQGKHRETLKCLAPFFERSSKRHSLYWPAVHIAAYALREMGRGEDALRLWAGIPWSARNENMVSNYASTLDCLGRRAQAAALLRTAARYGLVERPPRLRPIKRTGVVVQLCKEGSKS